MCSDEGKNKGIRRLMWLFCLSAVFVCALLGAKPAQAEESSVTMKTVSKKMSVYQHAAIEYDTDLLQFASATKCWEQGGIVTWNKSIGIKFSSSSKKVASVDKNGEIVAKKAGKTVITATTSDRVLKVKLTVKAAKNKVVALKKLQCYKHYLKYMNYSQFNRAYKKAVRMVRELLDVSKKAKLIGVATILRAYFDQNMSYSMKKAHYNDPYGYLIKKTASCAGAARTTGMCLNILGVKFEHVNENKYSHQWARVKVGKKYWICDPYGLYVGPEPGTRKHPYL